MLLATIFNDISKDKYMSCLWAFSQEKLYIFNWTQDREMWKIDKTNWFLRKARNET